MPLQAPFDPETFTVSRVPFEHYMVERGAEALNREFPRGKRMHCEGVRDQRRSTIFDQVAMPLDLEVA